MNINDLVKKTHFKNAVFIHQDMPKWLAKAIVSPCNLA